MIEELNELEKNYLELFIGTTVKHTYTYEFVFIPQNENDIDIPVFAFNEKLGVKPIGQLPQEDIYFIKINPQINFDLWNQQQAMFNLNKKWKKRSGYKFR